mgnify:CR=1 FL=1
MQYRYEIKIPISIYNENILDNFLLTLKKLKVHNADREINNIYFDTLNFDSAQNNLDGVPNRTKYRVRWYKKDNVLSGCNTELKIKKGRLNRKLIIPTKIKSTEIVNQNLFDLIKEDFIKLKINDRDLLTQFFSPMVQNCYNRNYYIYDDDIRLTYDSSIKHKSLKTDSISNWQEDNLNVLEIKFDTQKLSKAQQLISRLPFVTKRHSKYLRGLSICKMAVYS